MSLISNTSFFSGYRSSIFFIFDDPQIINDNFNKLQANVYNLGLSSANITKYMLAKEIKKQLKYLKIKIIKNKKDPDQRDYYVSNKKIEEKGFKAKIKIEEGINELIKIFTHSKEKIINNY